MLPARLLNALQKPGDAISEVEQVVAEAKSERDPPAAHIFVSRRLYRA